MNASGDNRGKHGAGRTSRQGRHAVESPKQFWMRIIAWGSAKSLRNVGGLVALISVAGLIAVVVGGLWYLAVGDILGDRRTAATSAIAGALVVGILVAVVGARVMLPDRHSSGVDARRRRRDR